MNLSINPSSMKDDEQLIKKRLLELSRRSYARNRYEFSEFLNLAEQDILCRTKLDSSCSPYTLTGGFQGAERQIAMFGGEDICGYESTLPLCWLCISPALDKFANDLSHRDYLGSLMALGIRRELLGDILLDGKTAYLVCLDSISAFIISELKQVRRTTVNCRLCDSPPEIAVLLPDISELVISSERIDSVVSAVYQISRSEGQELILSGSVYISGKPVQSSSHALSVGSIVSVRGMGRFIYEGISRETKKNRLRVMVRKYE